MTEQQILKLAAALVEHQSEFGKLSTEDAQYVIQHTVPAISLFVQAVKDRPKDGIKKDPVDGIIRDRTVPTYPDWVKKVMHPDLQATRLAEYGMDQVQQWLCPDQENGVASGNIIYQHLQDTDTLKDQLGLADLLAIQVKGIVFFRKHFAGKAVFGWKSVVLDHDGFLGVPCLFEHVGQVLVRWRWLGYGWDSDDPGLCFASI